MADSRLVDQLLIRRSPLPVSVISADVSAELSGAIDQRLRGLGQGCPANRLLSAWGARLVAFNCCGEVHLSGGAIAAPGGALCRSLLSAEGRNVDIIAGCNHCNQYTIDLTRFFFLHYVLIITICGIFRT